MLKLSASWRTRPRSLTIRFFALPRPAPAVAILLAALPAFACGGGGGETAVRLVDAFDPDRVVGTVLAADELDSTAGWSFSDNLAIDPEDETEHAVTMGWQAVEGIENLRLEGGRLTGTSTNATPVLMVTRPGELDDPDHLYGIELRMRASGGANIRMQVAGGGEEMPEEQLEQLVAGADFSPFTTPLLPGDETQSYFLEAGQSTRMSGIRHVLLHPVDEAGATFEIEELRLVSQREYLSSIPSGPGWQGLKDIYREAIVSRAPESVRIPVRVPDNAWLDLHVGTVEEGAVLFRVRIATEGEDPSAGELRLEYTVTTPFRWDPVPVDLQRYAGREITLEFSLEAEEDGTLGFWGSPAVRPRQTASPLANDPPDAQVSGDRFGMDPPQGVIVILADTLRSDHLSPYGYERDTSPILSRFASEGVLFTDTVSQGTWTKVSTPSIFTSLYPTSHRVSNFTDRLSDAATTMAEIYRDAGFATAAFSSVLFTGKFSNMNQGYEELHESSSLIDQEYPAKSGREFVDRAIEWLELHVDVPFFLFLHVFDPHDPFKPRPPYDALWADPAMEEEHEHQLEEVRESIEDPLMKLFGMPNRPELVAAGIDPEAFVGYDVDWYDGSIQGMDVEIGRLLQRLEYLGLSDRTLIAFTSDHGEEFLEHGRMFHGQTVYGELTAVPLILWGPGVVPSGQVIEDTVRSIDVMPTLLELSHLSRPQFLQGQSLVPLMAAAAERAAGDSGSLLDAAATYGWVNAPAVSEKALTEGFGAPPPGDTESYAIVLDGWKLIHNTVPEEGAPEFELYDHRQDPLDGNNVADANPEVVQRLSEALAAWREMAVAAQLPESSSLGDISPAELERLRALGYIR